MSNFSHIMPKYANFIVKHRIIVIIIALIITSILMIKAATLKIIIDPASLVPQTHEYVKSTNAIEKQFGSKYLLLVGIQPKNGNILQPQVIDSVKDITNNFKRMDGVVKDTLFSISSDNAKNIIANSEGFEVKPLLPANNNLSPTQLDEFKKAIKLNPVYENTVVAKDLSLVSVLVELKEHSDGFIKMMEPVKELIAKMQAQHPDVNIILGGNAVFLNQTEQFQARIFVLFPIAILVIGLLHFEAFRSWQGFVLPLVTALMAVVWGVGLMGWMGYPLDIFNSPTPILILAIAAGHAVQLLKRYYEEYDDIVSKDNNITAKDANTKAVINSIIKVGPVMIIAGGVAAIGFLSLLNFEIQTIRTFGFFTAGGVITAVILEMTFIPAVRSLLIPNEKQHELAKQAKKTVQKPRIWEIIPHKIANIVASSRNRSIIYVSFIAIIGLMVLAMQNVKIDNASKTFFSKDLSIQQDDDFLNKKLGGTNSLYIMLSGKDDDIKEPKVLQAMEQLQNYANTYTTKDQQAIIGKTFSIVDLIKRMHQAMNQDDVKMFSVPQDKNLVAQYILLYESSGTQGSLNSYVDDMYSKAKVTFLLKSGAHKDISDLISNLKIQANNLFLPLNIKVDIGGDVAQTIALTDTMVQGKIRNILQVMIAIFIVSCLVFRSFLAGTIIAIPLAIAVLGIFAIMGLTGIPLNIPNSLSSAMAVGIGADYAIYLLYRMREYIKQGVEYNQAIKNTLYTAGQASLFVATAVAGGYGVLLFSFNYRIHQWLSIFIISSMIISCIAALLLIPALLHTLKPKFITKYKV